ncbi:hypothetical protein AB0E27_41830 [Streptomyces sparsogenes]|uniref:hypothetical protein n=1 Tax=Streptomyces sparsogenes TaxID=67365 RepID=UPI0033F94138
MTVHTNEQPVPAASSATGHTVATSHPQTTTVKVLAVLLAVMTGAAAALAAYIVGDHVTKNAAEPIVWAGMTFVAATGLLILLEEKTGLLR